MNLCKTCKQELLNWIEREKMGYRVWRINAYEFLKTLEMEVKNGS